METPYIPREEFTGIIREAAGDQVEFSLGDFSSRLVDVSVFLDLMDEVKPWGMKYDNTRDGTHETRDCDDFTKVVRGAVSAALGECLVFAGTGYVSGLNERHSFVLVVDSERKVLYYEGQNGKIREWGLEGDLLEKVNL